MINKHKNIFLLILIIVFGIFLRTANTNKYLIWQDEAETIMNSIQVVEDGYPHEYFEGRKIFENESFIKIDDPVYRYASTNYYGSKYENNKGWLPYYYLAPFIKFFGVSESSTRLPFIIFFVLTAILVFLLAKKISKNKKIALLATFIFTIDYFSIYYGQQARYYSIFLFLSTWSLYLNYLYLENKKNIHLFWLTTSLILMFHTHIISFIFLSMFFIYYDIIKTKQIKFNKYIIYNIIYLLLFTVPWLILVKFWVNFYTHNTLSTEEGVKILWLLLSVMICVIIAYIKIIFKDKIKIKENINVYLLNFSIAYIIIVPILIPSESIATRLFIPLIPIFSIVLAKLFYEIFKNKKLLKKNIFYITIVLILYISLFTQTRQLENYGTTNNTKYVIEYAKETNLTKQDIITSNWQDLPLALYTDYDVYKITTLQPDFFNNYQNRIIAIFSYKHIERDNPKKNMVLSTHEFWLKHEDFEEYYPRLSTCEQKTLEENTLIFDCPALSEQEMIEY